MPAIRRSSSVLWIAKMAWRDTRTSRRRLLLYSASIMLGIAALVSIASFGDSLRRAVRAESSQLLGADLLASSGEAFSPAAEALLAQIGGRRTDEIAFGSMILFPRTGDARMARVHAVEDAYPLLGKFETIPEAAATEFRQGAGALVDESVMYQLGMQVGDKVKIGNLLFTVAGAVRSVPGQTPGFGAMVQPPVYIPKAFFEATGLNKRGSQLDPRAYFAFPPGVDANQVRREFRDRLRDEGVWLESTASREARAGRIIDNLERFLGLVGFVALLLGAVGVASGIHVFIRSKLTSIAVLRCVGATVRQTFLIYLLQAAVLGLVGSLAGVVIGVLLQAALQRVLAGMLPVAVPWGLSWPAIGHGIITGVGVTLAVALLPLLGVRRISPLLALRSTIEAPGRRGIDRAVLGVLALGLAGVTAVAIQQTEEWQHGVSFVLGTLVVFGVLSGLGRILMRLSRRMAGTRRSYVWRQGVANLFRPNNRTLLVILALGLGTFLVVTMQLAQGMLLDHVASMRGKSATNLVFYDIQSDQRKRAHELIERMGRPVLRDVPLVTMRIASIKGRPVKELTQNDRRDSWVYTREYRSTYRDTVWSETDTVVQGEWIGTVASDANPVPISVETEIAERLGVTIGDAITFDVQGIPVDCVVKSLRRIDKQRFDLWFFIVFPKGVLEGAPQFAAMATEVDDARQAADLQRAMFEAFPNVSAMDLRVLLNTMNAVLDMASLVFWVMALFVVGTGLIVLAAVMASGRFQRLRESVLLRTMGAAQNTIARIQLVEYWMLGTLAALAGVLLAWVGAWALGRWIFELEAYPAVSPMLWAWIIVTALTVLTGWLSGRRVLNHPPLEILRQEV